MTATKARSQAARPGGRTRIRSKFSEKKHKRIQGPTWYEAKKNYDWGDVYETVIAESIRAVARNNYDCGKVYGTVFS